MASNVDEDYPSGPITCCISCLSKKVKVREDNTWSASLIIAWTSSVISLILFLVAFGSVAWGQAVSADGDTVITRDIGLWQECHSDTGCQYINSQTTIGAPFQACQALAVGILMLLLIDTSLVICYTFKPKLKVKSRLRSAALWSKLFAFLLMVVLISVFATKWPEPKYSSPGYKTQVEYSFKLAVGSLCLEFTGLLLFYCEAVVLRDDEDHHLDEHTRIADYHEGYSDDGYVGKTGSYPDDSFVASSTDRVETSVQERVHGHMNAKSAFETISQAHNDSGQSAKHPNKIGHSPFDCKQQVSRRFTGITLAEPEYVSTYDVQSRVNPSFTHSTYDIDVHNSNVPDHNLNERPHGRLGSDTGVYHDRPHGRLSSDTGVNKGSLSLHKGPGAVVTSVSMYDLHNTSLNQFDDACLNVWHPNERVQVYRDNKSIVSTAGGYDGSRDPAQPTKSSKESEHPRKLARIHRGQVEQPKGSQIMSTRLPEKKTVSRTVHRTAQIAQDTPNKNNYTHSESKDMPTEITTQGHTNEALMRKGRAIVPNQGMKSYDHDRVSRISQINERHHRTDINHADGSVANKDAISHSNIISQSAPKHDGAVYRDHRARQGEPQAMLSSHHNALDSSRITEPRYRVSGPHPDTHVTKETGTHATRNIQRQRDQTGTRPSLHNDPRTDRIPPQTLPAQPEHRAPARRKRDQIRLGRDGDGPGSLSRAHSSTSLHSLHSVTSTATTIVGGCAESEI